jgi:hypothetical protein
VLNQRNFAYINSLAASAKNPLRNKKTSKWINQK